LRLGWYRLSTDAILGLIKIVSFLNYCTSLIHYC